MKKIKVVLILFVLMMLFTGCEKINIPQKTNIQKNVNNSEAESEVETDKSQGSFHVMSKAKDEVYVYNPYIYELCIYSPAKNSYTSCFGENELLEYCFELSAEYPYVSVGTDRNFYVFDFKHTEMENMYMETEGFIVPFATDGTYFYYIHKQVNGEHAIVLLDENKIKPVVDLEGKAVESGVICEGSLYYSNYIYDTDSYEIYAYDLSTKTEKIIKEDVNRGDLFVLNGEVLFSKQSEIYSDTIKIPYTGVWVKIIDEYDVLVEWDVDKDSNYLLRFTDINSGEVLAAVRGGINYVLKENSILVYSYAGVTEILMSGE